MYFLKQNINGFIFRCAFVGLHRPLKPLYFLKSFIPRQFSVRGFLLLNTTAKFTSIFLSQNYL